MTLIELPSSLFPNTVSSPDIDTTRLPSFLSVSLDIGRTVHANPLFQKFDLSALSRQVSVSLWNIFLKPPEIYLSCVDTGRQRNTSTVGNNHHAPVPPVVHNYATPQLSMRSGISFTSNTTRRNHASLCLSEMQEGFYMSSWLAEILASNLERSLTLEAAVDGWTRALALRDHETLQHTLRVAEMTILLSQKIGISEELLQSVRRGAKLHDIGKMGIPDDVLLKPGPLNSDDWAIMQKHPGLAYEMLQPIPNIDCMLEIPYCHHEKWDGSGYPRGLKGEQIPLAARVFTVVDVWDALCSDRPYRPAWRRSQVIQYLIDQSGRHFDPRVVSTFLELIDQISPCMDFA